MKNTIKSAIRISLIFLVICGIVYPLAVTGIGQLFFSNKADGSIATYKGKAVGSELLGQSMSDARFMIGRASSTSQNLAVSNPELKKRMEEDKAKLLARFPYLTEKTLPAELITTSASGVDPDITVEAAKVQVQAIATATGISQEEINGMIEKATKKKFLGIFGQERVNVLQVNLQIAEKLHY